MRLAGKNIGVEAPPKYKLIYFDARGICEAIRLIFKYANESFVDERISQKEWLKMKNRTLKINKHRYRNGE